MDEIDNIIFELFLLIRKVSSDWGYMFNYWVNIHPPPPINLVNHAPVSSRPTEFIVYVMS